MPIPSPKWSDPKVERRRQGMAVGITAVLAGLSAQLLAYFLNSNRIEKPGRTCYMMVIPLENELVKAEALPRLRNLLHSPFEEAAFTEEERSVRTVLIFGFDQLFKDGEPAGAALPQYRQLEAMIALGSRPELVHDGKVLNILARELQTNLFPKGKRTPHQCAILRRVLHRLLVQARSIPTKA